MLRIGVSPTDHELQEGLLGLVADQRPTRDLWPGVAAKIARDQARARIMRLVGTAAVFLACIGALLTPASAWASLSQVAVRLWTGLVGGAPATVIWIDPSSVPPTAEAPPLPPLSVSRPSQFADAAAQVGFEPYQILGQSFYLGQIEIPQMPNGGATSAYESRMVVANYFIEGVNYHLYTMGMFEVPAEGEPVLMPIPELPIPSVGATPPAGIRHVPVGQTEALCLEELFQGAPRTRCTLLLDGLMVMLTGPEPGPVEHLLQFVGRE